MPPAEDVTDMKRSLVYLIMVASLYIIFCENFVHNCSYRDIWIAIGMIIPALVIFLYLAKYTKKGYLTEISGFILFIVSVHLIVCMNYSERYLVYTYILAILLLFVISIHVAETWQRETKYEHIPGQLVVVKPEGDTIKLKCPSCGTIMDFSTETEVIRCPICGQLWRISIKR